MLLRNSKRVGGRVGTSHSRSAVCGTVLAASLLAGCSTDFRRLEQPSLTQGERSPLPTASLSTRRNAGAPIGQETWSDSGPRAPLPPITAATPPPAAPSLPVTAGISKPFDRPKPAASVAAPSARPAASGQTIEVQSGDSLYAISKRHNVAIADLMDANQLKSPALKPGQKLVLPAASSLRRPVTKPDSKAGAQVASAGTALPAAALPAPIEKPAAAAPAQAGDWTGAYTLKQGDSLYAIARQHKVSLADLQRQNNISDATKVRQGTVLKVPGSAGATALATPTAAPAAAAPRAAQITAAPTPPPAASSGTIITPKIINMQQRTEPAPGDATVAPIQPTPPIASAQPTPKAEPASAPAAAATAAGSSAASSAAKFKWPVKGPVVGAFGKRTDGSSNDGVAIGVPAGTDVHAAADGTIAYAGSELKGYGNLILVRHDGGWVTAYAHASELLVKRGDTVTRGQVIAKAGQTGGVDKPQVHFELRKDSKPIDPTPHMEKQ